MTKINLDEIIINKTMFPSKDMEYSADLQNFFHKTRNMDADSSYFVQNPFLTPMANRSSSSADSISPESYLGSPGQNYFNIRQRSQTPYNYETPKLSYESPPNYRQYESTSTLYETSHHMFDTYETLQDATNWRQPFATPTPTRQQPIVGRKILGRNHGRQEPRAEQELDWELPHIPESHKSYELFPSDKGFQFTLPTKTEQFSSPIPTPNTKLNWSQNVQNYTPPYNPGSNNQSNIGGTKMCTFCRKNGETPVVYMDHCLKEKKDKKFIVTCPILRSHVCPICNQSGDDAHTITYCPVLKTTNEGKKLTSTTITLKNTRIKSNGKRRY